MVTAKGAEYEKVKGLDLGADDYVAKPFGMMELVSRIKAVLRRTSKSGQETQDIMKAGELELDTKKHEVTAAGEVVNLTHMHIYCSCLSVKIVSPNIFQQTISCHNDIRILHQTL